MEDNKTDRNKNARAGMRSGVGPGGIRMGGGKAKDFKAAWGKLLRFCKPYHAITIIATIFAVGSAFIQVIRPSYIGDIGDNAFGFVNPEIFALGPSEASKFWATCWSNIVNIGILLVIMFSVMFLLSLATELIMATITQRIAKGLRSKIANKINRLPLKYFDKTSYGDVLSRITNDVDTVSQTLNQSLVTLISSVTLLLGSIVAMFFKNWLLAITAIASSFGGFILMSVIIKKSQKYFAAQQKALGAVNGYIEEYYSGHSVVSVSNAQKNANAEMGKRNNDMFQSAWRSQFYSGLMMPLMGFISNFSYLCICVVGGLLFYNGAIGVGTLVAFMLYVRIFTQPLSQIAQAATNLQSTAAASERVFEFLDEEEMPDERKLTDKLETVKGAVRFNNVRFGYDADKVVIKNFTADIKPGSKVAIVGPTGAGKTTLVNLLMKFYNVDSGDILIDGVSINKLSRENVHDLFGMVLQDTWLFEGTVRENLTYNNTNVTTEMLDKACETAGIDHFISTLPHGYDTVLNEQASVSNGQKQLLTIARAMIKDSPLLILDEATSSVDTRTEVLLQKAMDKLTKNRTSFVIAHRLSTIKNADLILVMKDGDIIENGTHEHLMKQKGFYADLYNSQFTLDGASA